MDAVSSSPSPATPVDVENESCDTLPAPLNLAYPLTRPPLTQHQRQQTPEQESSSFDVPLGDDSHELVDGTSSPQALPAPIPPSASSSELEPKPIRQLCKRHQRMADQGTNLQLQQSLNSLPPSERELVNNVWFNFSSSNHARRAIILQGLLTMCCSSQLSLISEQLAPLLRTDPFIVFPTEVSLRVLKYLDAVSLTRAAQVSRRWRCLADDDVLWRNMCEQHIGNKCAKCGWGLPLLEGKRNKNNGQRPGLASMLSSTSISSAVSTIPTTTQLVGKKRTATHDDVELPLSKKQKVLDHQMAALARIPSFSSASPDTHHHHHHNSDSESESVSPLLDVSSSSTSALTRSWKAVYSERLTVERNWRRSRYTVSVLTGHTDGVMCLQFNENLQHPAFPVLITGSYDRTVRVWNLETGAEVRCMRGHTRAIRALQFDEAKLITGSMDHTLKVWNWRTGKCIRTLEGHTEGVVCLTFDANVLASGSVDTTVKVWNFRTGECFTLRGHRDWVNAVSIWDGRNVAPSHHDPVPGANGEKLPDLDVGKMLFSASDDGTIRLWDLTARSCVKTFTGHVGQVQSIKLVFDWDSSAHKEDESSASSSPSLLPTLPPPTFPSTLTPLSSSPPPRRRGPVLISGSLDNTVKTWDVETGETIQTYFGHIEGVWAVATDKLRFVSASHDRTIKIWARDQEIATNTLFGHRAAVTCVSLADDKIVSGSDDGDIRIWSFAPEPSGLSSVRPCEEILTSDT